MNIQDKLNFLQIQEVTTDKQKANGTREFKLPMNDPYGVAIHVASFASGYVRRTKTGGYSSDWQLNKTKKKKRYVEMTDYDTGSPVIKTFLKSLLFDENKAPAGTPARNPDFCGERSPCGHARTKSLLFHRKKSLCGHARSHSIFLIHRDPLERLFSDARLP